MILLWRVTTLCNQACGFCAYDRRLAMARVAVAAEEVERVSLLVAAAAEARGERLLVSWLGGEPFVWEPLLNVSARLALHPAVRVSATTNGSRLGSAAVRAAVLKHFAELTFSLDGSAGVHDRLRGTPGAHDRAAAAIQALAAERAARGAGLRLRVNSVLMRRTLPGFADLSRTVAGWGVDEITFNQLGGRDRPEFFPDEALTPGDVAQLRALLPELRAELAARDVRLCGSELYLERFAASSRGEPLAAAEPCIPGEQMLFVDERGLVAPCSFTGPELGVPTTELRSVADVQALGGGFARRRALGPKLNCSDCPSTQLHGKFAA